MDKERDRVQKLIVLQPNYYKKLSNRISPPPSLLNVEKRFIDILKDKRLNDSQRLFLYQDILSVRGMKGLKSRSLGALNEIGSSAAKPTKKRSVSFNISDTAAAKDDAGTDSVQTIDEDDSIWENDKFKTAISPPNFIVPESGMTSTPMKQLVSSTSISGEPSASSSGEAATYAFEGDLPKSVGAILPKSPTSPKKKGGGKRNTSRRSKETPNSPYDLEVAKQLSKTGPTGMNEFSTERDTSTERASSVGKNLSHHRRAKWISYEEGCKRLRRE